MSGSIFGSNLRSKAIGWLFCHPDERFHVRRLEGLLNEDSTNLSRELARLAREGLLTAESEGRQKYYQANPRCSIFNELKGIAVKTTGVADVVREALRPLAVRIRVAFIYGSLASGDFSSRSDVDVMVIGTATFAEISEALRGLVDRLGREVNATVYPPEELRGKYVADHHFILDVMDRPRIFLIGDERELAAVVGKRVGEEAPDNP